MVLSRQARLYLLGLSTRLGVGRGERSRVLANEVPSKLMEDLRGMDMSCISHQYH
jgi:hypothetical protein